jgi:hypothetical protein
MKIVHVSVLVNIVLAMFLGGFLSQQFGIIPESSVGDSNALGIEAKKVQFNSSELQTWLGIKSRLAVINTDPDFTGDRTLEWISMRNSTSAPWDNYYQKSMEFLCFWSGQGASGEWEAVVSIYNRPNSTSVFVIEFARFTWHSLDLTIDGAVVHSFVQVTENGAYDGYYSTEIYV